MPGGTRGRWAGLAGHLYANLDLVSLVLSLGERELSSSFVRTAGLKHASQWFVRTWDMSGACRTSFAGICPRFAFGPLSLTEGSPARGVYDDPC